MAFRFTPIVEYQVTPAMLAKLGESGSAIMVKWFREGLVKAVQYWHSQYLPFHFTSDAFTRYPGAYVERKRKGRQKPLVDTGNLRRAVKSAKAKRDRGGTLADVSASVRLKSSQVYKTVKRKASYVRGAAADQYAKELTAVNDAELRILNKIFTGHVHNRFLMYRTRKVKKP